VPADFDATDFIDGDFHEEKSPATSIAAHISRAPTREEVDSRVAEAQQKLAELKRAQETLERERASLEETRRRQREYQTGRQEMTQNLTRGLGLLEKAEFEARRDAEQMARALADFREALTKIESVHDESWTQENFGSELTRALTAIENARMEWNSARLKFPILSQTAQDPAAPAASNNATAAALVAGQSFGSLCRLGFALTWPLAAAALLALAGLIAVLARR
jgi:chromosome segregation ATPase